MKKLKGILKIALGVTLISPAFVAIGVGVGLKAKSEKMENQALSEFINSEAYNDFKEVREEKMEDAYFFRDKDYSVYKNLSTYYSSADFILEYMKSAPGFADKKAEAEHTYKVGDGFIKYGIVAGAVVTMFAEASLNDFVYKNDKQRGFYTLFKTAAADLKGKKKEDEVVETVIASEIQQ